MNTQTLLSSNDPVVTTLPPAPSPDPWIQRRSVLAEGGVDGRLFWLGPNAETAETLSDASRDRVVFVASGLVTLSLEPTHRILSGEEAAFLKAGQPAVFRNRAESPSRLLVFTLPVRPRPADTLVRMS